MIPLIIGIIGIVFYKIDDPNQKLSKLTVDNIEALSNSTELPGITVMCSSGYYGWCFVPGTRLAMRGEYMYYPCEYVGNPNLFCSNPV